MDLSKLNIVQAYTKFNSQFIVFVSGISGCGKTSLAKNISDKFDINLLEQFHYHKKEKDYDRKVTLPDGTEHVNYYTDDAIDMKKFTKDIKKLKKQGVVVSGISLTDKLDVKPDFHIHLSMSKQMCMEKRRKFLKRHKDKYPEESQLVNTTTEKLKMNRLIFPYYLDAKSRSKIDQVLNINEMTDNQVWDVAFNILVKFIKSQVKKKYYDWLERDGPEEDEPEHFIQPTVEPTEDFPIEDTDLESLEEVDEMTVNEPIKESEGVIEDDDYSLDL